MMLSGSFVGITHSRANGSLHLYLFLMLGYSPAISELKLWSFHDMSPKGYRLPAVGNKQKISEKKIICM